MANVIRIKRRVSGAAGAPVALKSAELAHNEVDDTLYVGKGDDGGGNATSVARGTLSADRRHRRSRPP